MVDIFDEVEEDLREERMQAFLKKYGAAIIGACFLVVAAVAGWKAWGWYQTRQDLAAATQYLDAVAKIAPAGAAKPDLPAAIAALRTAAAAAPEGYRTLERLREAALLAASGDLQGASALWDEVAADHTADPLLRDLASLIWCQHHLDTGDPELVRRRLDPLTDAGNPWRPLAQEQMALLDLRLGRTDQAKTALRKLVEDPAAPGGARGRAGALLDRLGG